MRGKGGEKALSLDPAANRLRERCRATGIVPASSARGGWRRLQARRSRSEFARTRRMTSAPRSHATMKTRCWSIAVVTGEESESGRSGRSGRNLQRTARAASIRAAAEKERSTSRDLKATPPPLRRC
jgi:hypothetical protein